jgi:hypothetical protein
MSDILTDAELAEIEKRAEAATPGLWFSNAGMLVDVAAPGKANDGQNVCRMPGGAGSRSSHDADFIAHARTDIPRLLKEIARLRGIEERGNEEYSNALPYRDFETNELLNASPWQAQTVVEMLEGILFGYEAEGEGKVSEPDACHEEGR